MTHKENTKKKFFYTLTNQIQEIYCLHRQLGAKQSISQTDKQELSLTIMAKSVMKSTAKPALKMRKRRNPESFKSYIRKVLKQVHPQTRISKKSIAIVNNFVTDTFDSESLV